MRKEDVFLAYKMLVQMRDLADKLEDSINKKDFENANQIKHKLIELQGGLNKVL